MTGTIINVLQEHLVREFQRVLEENGIDIKPNSVFNITAISSEVPVPGPLKYEVTFQQLCEEYFDLTAIPRRYTFSILSQLTDSELEKEKCEEFTTAQGQEELYSYCNRPRRNIVEVLRDFPHATKNLTKEMLFEILTPIKPRDFSIASSYAKYRNEIHILVAVVKYKTKLVKERLGLCSNYLADLKIGDRISVWLKKGSFSFPKNTNNTVIMVGPGTGIAPFRNYIQECVANNSASKDNLILFFGCRGKEKDFHCAEELTTLQKQNKLNLICAFSRDQKNKVYVQHKVLEEGSTIWNAVKDHKACIFVAGNSKNMPQEVREAFVISCVEYGNLSKEEAEKLIQDMERTNKYQTETCCVAVYSGCYNENLCDTKNYSFHHYRQLLQYVCTSRNGIATDYDYPNKSTLQLAMVKSLIKEDHLIREKNGIVVHKADSEKTALQHPVRLQPSWEESNLPEEELNFQKLTMDDASLQLNTPMDRYNIVYFIFILHGIGTLMPWNMFINANDYFTKYKLDSNYTGHEDNVYKTSFLQYLGFAAQVPNVIFNWLNIFVQLGGNLTTRIVWSICIEVIVFVFTIILAMVDSRSWPGAFFWLTMISVVILNIMNGIYQNTIFGMAAKLPPKYTGAVILGTNISGTFTAVVSILSSLLSSNQRMQAIYYFITALFVLLLCFDTYFALPLNRFYRHHELKEKKEEEMRQAKNISTRRIPYLRIFRQALPQLTNVFLVFFVTLSLFPAVQAIFVKLKFLWLGQDIRRSGRIVI
ncbi:Nucleoside transporter [Popillia japonica]|uniref:Nucleoside transporter n=1 Tax=Popillia japonica TaxID=7064 RepID=A0AAW1IFP9_POPJA